MIAPGKLFWRFFLGNSLIIAAVLATCFWLTMDSLERARSDEVRRRLTADAHTFRILLGDQLRPQDAAQLNHTVRELTRDSAEHIRITAILADGSVLADSESDAPAMENHANRREVRDALASGWGEDLRFSHTVLRPMRYVAVRIGPPERPVGVIRVAMSQALLDEQNRRSRRLLWTIAGIGLLASLALALGLARLWSRPIKLITRTARNISRGDLSARVPVSGNDELALLARSLNEMRDHLAAQLETIDGQRRTLQSLLSQLHEGVAVADAGGRIVLLNPAALRLLGIPRSAGPARSLEGVSIDDCITKPDLRDMLRVEDLAAPHTHEDVREIRVQSELDGGEISLRARASDILLPGAAVDPHAAGTAPPIAGRLLVLTDVTDLSRMIQIKADFAANASHELRTPLSTIRAAVETLLQVDLRNDAESAREFINVVDRHSSRLEAIVSDLLNLSRLESSPSFFQLGRLAVDDLLGDLRARFAERMHLKGLAWTIDHPPRLATMYGNLHLLRLILDNLLDNAIKFTDSGGSIRLGFRTSDEPEKPAVVIEVADTGCGIPEEDQPRVFERFYQVERSRSASAARGTGLGLSIVRHAVATMKGTVELRSRVGEGTTVTVRIPQPADADRPGLAAETAPAPRGLAP